MCLERFQVLTTVNIKKTALWDTASCTFGEVNSRFRRAYCIHLQAPSTCFNKTPRGAQSQKAVIFTVCLGYCMDVSVM
jgi:hypothetical protein